MKVVINKSAAQFALSGPAETLYTQLSGLVFDYWRVDRTCQHLVQVVEALGTSANGLGCELTIVEVSGPEFIIVQDSQGFEQIESTKATKNVQTPQANQETL